MNLWLRKLAAYLHDPPEKAYDFGLRHLERARSHAEAFGVAEAIWQKQSDWSAAAADRFIAPKGSPQASLGGGVQFFHPLAGAACAVPGECFPSQAEAEEFLASVIPTFAKGLENGGRMPFGRPGASGGSGR